jgi:hypothetical protein
MLSSILINRQMDFSVLKKAINWSRSTPFIFPVFNLFRPDPDAISHRRQVKGKNQFFAPTGLRFIHSSIY